MNRNFGKMTQHNIQKVTTMLHMKIGQTIGLVSPQGMFIFRLEEIVKNSGVKPEAVFYDETLNKE